MFTKTQIENAKQIREEAAEKFGCTVKEIYWPACVALSVKKALNNEIVKTWKTVSGLEVIVTGKLITEKTNYSDGYNITVDTCEIEIDVKVGGKSQGSWVREMSTPQIDALKAKGYTQFSHMVGKLVLTPEQVGIIQSVREELEATPEWQKKQAIIAKNEAYTNNKMVGWCDKCQSYCFGDCEAN